jgi:transcriptional regulator with XRE-family HTH domain
MLSELLRSHRQSAGLTLEALSEVSKISARTISDIERGVSISPQGRTVEALAAALGLKPAQHDEFLLAARSRGRSRGRALRASAGTPHRILDFAGRGAEIAEVTAYLEVAADRPEWTAVLLTGAPGIGKSASAMEALDRPHKGPAEIVFVDLDGFSAGPLTPLQVLQAVLRQMPGIGVKAPADLDEAGRLWRAASAENPRSVVLDNAAVEQQVRPVMAADPRSKVIITSRRSLAGLEGVKRVTLGPLSEQDSMHLLERLIPEGQRRSGDLWRCGSWGTGSPAGRRGRPRNSPNGCGRQRTACVCSWRVTSLSKQPSRCRTRRWTPPRRSCSGRSPSSTVRPSTPGSRQQPPASTSSMQTNYWKS